jgi:hypothetical protein
MPDEPPKWPETPDEWREALTLARGWIAIDSCRQYGLVQGGPTINVDRCVEILKEGTRRRLMRDVPNEVTCALICIQLHNNAKE